MIGGTAVTTAENSTSGSEVTVIDNNSASGSDTTVPYSLPVGIFITASTMLLK